MAEKAKVSFTLIILTILLHVGFINIAEAKEDKKADVTVLGGGICGTFTALKLAEAGYSVTLIERQSLLAGSSDKSVHRMGLGFHYIGEIATAKKVLNSTLAFAKKYQNYTVDKTKAEGNFLSYGRYFLLRESIAKGFITKEKFIQELNLLRQYYTELVQEDITNQVFGLPENFYRILSPEEYKHEVGDIDKVEIAIEVKEYILDWPKFKNYILTQLAFEPKIKILTNFEVIDAKKDSVHDGYCITAVNNKQERLINCTPFVVNALWENIESLDKKIGFLGKNEIRTNRLKLLVEVELPDQLKNKSSMFFFKGPYGMFVNEGDGIARFTYAGITNYKNSTDIELPAEFKRIITKGLTEEEKADLAPKMIKGIAEFIPQMKYAKVKNIMAGIVKSKGIPDINDPDNEVHKRAESGLEEKAKGWIDNGCMKFFSCEYNANKVLEIIESAAGNGSSR